METEQERILKAGKTECSKCVGPEGYSHRGDSPITIWMIHLVRLNNVLLRSSNDGGDRQEERTQEETLAFMGYRCFESPRVFDKPEEHGEGDDCEEKEIEDIENSADSDETGKRMWLN